MSTLRHRTALFAVLLLGISSTVFVGCKKDKATPAPRTFVAVFLDNKDVNPVNTIISYSIYDLLMGGAEVGVSSIATGNGGEIPMSDNVPYSFTLQKSVFYGNYTFTSVAYTGTIAKALFTNTTNDPYTPNRLTISVINASPMLYLNGVRLPDPTRGTPPGGGTGGTNTCPLGTWQTPTCNGASGKFLVYNFGALNKGYSENSDCNGICGNIKYNFTYTVSGNTITYTFTSVDPVVCSGATQQPPMPNPAGPYSITYTCGNNGNQLVTEAVNTRTGVRTVLTFARR